MSIDALQLRCCSTLEEFNACVELQREVWGFSDLDLVPLRVFSVASKIGGQVIGAWDGDTMVGFALSLPATHRRYPYLHSHMLGVKESYRNTGLGRRIKLFQREDAIALGYDLIEWTFDPLEIKNAYFNLERLGAIARRYNLNQYGITTSPLQGFLPTDRLVAEWWLKSKRVESLLVVGTSAWISAGVADLGSCRDLCLEGRGRNASQGRRGAGAQSRAVLEAFAKGCRAWAMAATIMAAEFFWWGAGTKIGRSRRRA